MEEKYSGIVVGGVNFSENDRIINIFTLERGMISAKIKGVKKAGAKLKFAAEPFCFAEFIVNESGDRRTVIGASLIDSFYSVREDIVKFYCGGAVLEFVKKFLKEEIVSEEVFSLTVNGLKDIAYGDENPKSVLCRYLINVLRLAGYAINLKGCNNCKGEITGRTFFDYREGAFYCEKCFKEQGREIKNSTFTALKDCFNKKTVNESEITDGLKLLNYYFKMKTEEEIKSLKELIDLK